MIRFQRITIIKSRIPERDNLNYELQWFGNSLGLFNLRDKDKSCFRIFITLLKSVKRNEMLSSDELADRLCLSRGTVVFHLNKLIDSGIVITKNKRYMLRVDNLKELIDEMERDMQKACNNLRDVAKDIDDKLEL
jgi:predicted transcriptional regulator